MCVKPLPVGDTQQMIVLIIIISAPVINADTVSSAASTGPSSVVN